MTLLDPKKTQNPSPTFMKKRRAFYKDIFTTINFAQYAISYIQSLYPPTQAESINKLNTDLWLTCILLPHKRFLPLQKGMPLGPDHINAGVSFQGISKTLDDISLYQYQKQNQHNQTLPTFTTSSLQRRVLIYREEHVHKVILHELIHAYDIDYNNYDDKCVEKKEKALKQFFEYNLQNDKLLDLNETFTELLACYLHLFLYRFLLQKHNSTNNVPRVSCLIKQEQETYHRTSQTLLSHFECNASKENTKYSTYLPATCNYPLRENTHMYAYLISKAELWDHLNKIPLTVNKSSDFYAFLDYISILSQLPSKDKIPKNVKPLFTMTSLKTEEMISKNKV